METNENEIWRDIPDYEGIYQVSNLGNVKSLSRLISKGSKRKKHMTKDKSLKQMLLTSMYNYVVLYKNLIPKNKTVHRLVMLSFTSIENPELHQVNHINGIRIDNRVENLEWVNCPENNTHSQLSRKIKKSSIYTGVFFCKTNNKWKAQIVINGKQKHLGYFQSEELAAEKYKEAAIFNNKINKYSVTINTI